MRISCWQDPPQSLFLAAKQLHLWRIALPVTFPTHQPLKHMLSPDEASRADRLLDRNKAAEFVVARSRLRQILANYLNIQATELVFAYGPAGKPQLHAGLGSNLTFNLSHSGEWALLAVAAGTEIGVDLERIDPDLDFRAVAGKFFTPNEKALLAHCSEARRRRGFYRIWTRKEARLKRSGLGFTKVADHEAFCSAETTRVFPIGRSYLGAIATCAEVSSIRRFQLLEPYPGELAGSQTSPFD